MKNSLGLDDFIGVIKIAGKDIADNKEFLSNLDSVIGDGDHGTTISTAFTKICQEISSKSFATVSELLKFTGNLFLSTIGGTTGPIFGYMFIGMSLPLSGLKENTVALNDYYKMMASALNKVISIGKAEPGDKTLVDTLNSAVSSLKKSVEQNTTLEEAIKKMAEDAKKGAESTKNMIAKKGRARYLGERSLGHQDAGATSVSIILNAFNKYLQNKEIR